MTTLLALDATAQPVDAPAEAATTDFVEMVVSGVMRTEFGNVVLLADASETRIVPIFVGETEALAIALRLDDAGFQRPLTHDLIDALLRELGAELIGVRIDALEQDVFTAVLTIRHGEREITLDARASDSIALALGADIPILVSERVIEQAGFGPDGRPTLPRVAGDITL